MTQAVHEMLQSAIACHELGQIAGAEKLYHEILQKSPDHPDALYLLGLIAHQSGKTETAISLILRAISVRPDSADYYYNLGRILESSGRKDNAVHMFVSALQRKPDYLEAYESLVRLKPDAAEAHFQIGNLYQSRGMMAEAVNAFRLAVDHKPDFFEAYNNLASILEKHFGKSKEAVKLYQQALSIRSDHPGVHNNIGAVRQFQMRLTDAMDHFSEAIRMDPENVAAHFQLSTVLLLSGRFEEGWKEYEWRRLKPEWKEMIDPNLDVLQWDGSDFRDKTIYIHDEQGYGDTLNFIRYLPMVKERGGTVLFETSRALLPLLENFPGVDQFIIRNSLEEPLPDYQIYSPLASLPGIFGTDINTIPLITPHRYSDPRKVAFWKKRIGPDGYRIGIAWSGNPSQVSNRRRACSPDFFVTLADIPGIRLFSLQKGTPAGQLKNAGPGNKIDDLSDEIEDFSDTAAIIENLDLIISVDTSIPHLAGVMGMPVWILLAYSPDWRWLTERKDSPWYPTMRLFRQHYPDNWSQVLHDVISELSQINQ